MQDRKRKYYCWDIVVVDDIFRGDMRKNEIIGCSAFSGSDYKSVIADAESDTGFGIVRGFTDDRLFRIEKNGKESLMPYIIIRQKKRPLIPPRQKDIFDSALLTIYVDKVRVWMEENGHDTGSDCIPDIAEYLFWHFSPEKELESEIKRLYIASVHS